MRTDIVLDDRLVAEALSLTGSKSKKDVIHLALLKLIEAEKSKHQQHARFMATYIDHPEQLEQFSPLSRDAVNER